MTSTHAATAAAPLDNAPLPFSYAVSTPAAPPDPATRVQRGRRLVVSGFCIAVLGVLVYCFGALSSVPPVETLEAGGDGALSRGVIVGLSLIGTGTLLWLIGMVRHLGALLDLPADSPENEG